jgi:hypothetical protein
MKNWAEQIPKAKSLDMLHDLLVEAATTGARLDPVSDVAECRVDLGALPSFGGFRPEGGIIPALSWDMRCVLAGDSLANLRIVSRKMWGERRTA